MDIKFQEDGQWSADCALIFLFQDADLETVSTKLWYSRPWIDNSPAMSDFSGKKDESALHYNTTPLSTMRVALTIGLGKPEECSLQEFRNAVAKATVYCRDKGFVSLGLAVETLDPIAASLDVSLETLVKESACAALLSLYRLDAYRSEKAPQAAKDPRYLAFMVNEEEVPAAMVRAGNEGKAEAKGVILARNLANGPANYVTPAVLAAEARILAERHDFSCAIFGPEEIRAMDMGALWAVARGAKEEPRFIILEHCPKGKENDDPIILVGKGITFDTGGISLKPSAKMHEMKGDMGGAAAVLGFFEALGHMEDAGDLPRVIGLVPSAENMPGGNATRPGDVITTLSGKTVEIQNTDAEGRLILCDALAYAQKNWQPKALVDVATLTGACVVALGDYATGLFTDDVNLRQTILGSAEAVGDLCWPLPMWKDYDANIKSDVADMSNVGPREGGAIHAALFLRRFIEKNVPWVHLDIAGPGYVVKAGPMHPVPGATGVGVRLFCRILREMA